ncbi:hypothetical protein AGLY_008761 [Aphis glycines]|uniref:Uncharacterized protein n=1 Tax=Aphis glycines TaxID=307491 RepID=A0A6G0TKD5_APHGL|nr:hypothetical protein AGLY_008761 [Aphis glycines]
MSFRLGKQLASFALRLFINICLKFELPHYLLVSSFPNKISQTIVSDLTDYTKTNIKRLVLLNTHLHCQAYISNKKQIKIKQNCVTELRSNAVNYLSQTRSIYGKLKRNLSICIHISTNSNRPVIINIYIIKNQKLFVEICIHNHQFDFVSAITLSAKLHVASVIHHSSSVKSLTRGRNAFAFPPDRHCVLK